MEFCKEVHMNLYYQLFIIKKSLDINDKSEIGGTLIKNKRI